MATKEQHLKKAEHNEAFFNEFEIDATPYLDWVVTGIFYSAIHYIRAVAAKHRFINISSYGEIDRMFSTVSIFKRNSDVYIDYRQLKDDSRAARYEITPFSATEVIGLRDQEFKNIKSFALTNL